MVSSLGLDIGGANLKATHTCLDYGRITSKTLTRYFPIWIRGKEALPHALLKLKPKNSVKAVGATVTAELSDVYATKREGIHHVLDSLSKVWKRNLVYMLGVDAKLHPRQAMHRNPIIAAAANWAATGWLASRIFEDCIVIDVGTTTTSIIPVLSSRIKVRGKNDLKKLACGELVYTGVLRTNIAAITQHLIIDGKPTRVSSELFSLSSDVHLILRNISRREYTTETADGRGRSVREAEARLARVVCSDREQLTPRQIRNMAMQIHHKQIEAISEALIQVSEAHGINRTQRFPIITAGLGRGFLAERAARKSGFRKIIDAARLFGPSAAGAIPSYAVSLMVLEEVGCDLRPVWSNFRRRIRDS